MAEVVLSHLTRRFPGEPPAGLFDCSLRVSDGEILTIVGPSGSGKTTLLRLVAGLERPDTGVVRISDRDVTRLPPAQRDVALVSQRPILYPHLSILRNLSIGLEMRQARHLNPAVSSAEVHRRVHDAVGFLGLESLLHRRVDQLSGGEIQRVVLGRVLVRQPAVWLLDEPFSHLDAAWKLQFRRELLLLRGHSLATMIFVTHDPDEAMSLGQRLAVLHRGHVRQVGQPIAVQCQPDHRCVAELLGRPPMNFVHGAWARSGPSLRFAAADGTILLPMPAELVTHGAEGQPVAVGIRPEDVIPNPSSAAVPTQDNRVSLTGWVVRVVEPWPMGQLVTAGYGRWLWSYWVTGEPAAAVGQTVTLQLPLEKCFWFDANGNRLRSGKDAGG